MCETVFGKTQWSITSFLLIIYAAQKKKTHNETKQCRPQTSQYTPAAAHTFIITLPFTFTLTPLWHNTFGWSLNSQPAHRANDYLCAGKQKKRNAISHLKRTPLMTCHALGACCCCCCCWGSCAFPAVCTVWPSVVAAVPLLLTWNETYRQGQT